MNIDLSKASDKSKTKKKKGGDDGLGLGLNQRGGGAGKRRKAKKKSAFGDDDDESSSDDEAGRGGPGSRSAINRAIANEQAALRKRAMMEASNAIGGGEAGNDVYDYDGAYDSFKKKDDDRSKEPASDAPENKKSRYIGDLLKAAEHRLKERESILERRIAKEQALEEMDNPEFAGKETFITAAYKRKLEERNAWKSDEERKAMEEQEQDVTKKKNTAMSNFYSNLNSNVALGGGGSGEQGAATATKAAAGSSGAGLGFVDDFKRPASDGAAVAGGSGENAAAASSDGKVVAAEDKKLAKRLLREKKVKEARVRYFQRHPERQRLEQRNGAGDGSAGAVGAAS
jgi:hypothetical protein